jgi:two-component system sensor histidine kinase ChvG
MASWAASGQAGPADVRYYLIFSSLTRRILFLNLAALVVLVSGILYLNQFREGLIDARVESLLTQGEIIAGAVAASASVDTNSITIDPEKLLRAAGRREHFADQDSNENLDFPINPERVAPVLRRLISPTRTRARIYDDDAQPDPGFALSLHQRPGAALRPAPGRDRVTRA